MYPEAARLSNGSEFFRTTRNPTKIDTDPQSVMDEAIFSGVVPGPGWDIIHDSTTNKVRRSIKPGEEEREWQKDSINCFPGAGGDKILVLITHER